MPPTGLPDVVGESDIVGSSPAMRRLRLQVRRIGPHFRTVLLTGETGTGKELVARALHAMRQNPNKPFVLYTAAELGDAGFGDALAQHQQGTLFLDGINRLSLAEQGHLLTALKRNVLGQINEAARESVRSTDLRIVAAATEDLKTLVSTGRFRQDLYQRLATVDISLPPLRDRMEDLPELARHFLGRIDLPHGAPVHEIADGAMMRMQCEGDMLESHHLPAFSDGNETDKPTGGARERLRLQDVVEEHVLRVLKDSGGNKLRAAEVLGISRSTLYRMLEMSAPDPASETS
jgi:DNA-binding NtrC family response regulator